MNIICYVLLSLCVKILAIIVLTEYYGMIQQPQVKAYNLGLIHHQAVTDFVDVTKITKSRVTELAYLMLYEHFSIVKLTHTK